LRRLTPGSPSRPFISDVTVKIPGGDQAKFDEAAKNAEKGCPVIACAQRRDHDWMPNW